MGWEEWAVVDGVKCPQPTRKKVQTMFDHSTLLRGRRLMSINRNFRVAKPRAEGVTLLSCFVGSVQLVLA